MKKYAKLSEHRRSEIERFSMLNERIISQTRNTRSLSVVNKFRDLHLSVTVISRQY